jgi:hypothetical protein
LVKFVLASNFIQLIKIGFKKHKAKCSSKIEFVVKDIKNIDEFLVGFHGSNADVETQPEISKASSEEATKLFDSIDMVFIDGEANYLPWSNRCSKFAQLFRMCKLTNKCLFAAGFGLSMQVYYCATNFENINVINGNSKGGFLGE